MSTLRYQILNAIQSRLETIFSGELNVYVYRMIPVSTENLPAINLIANGDTVEKDQAEIWNDRTEDIEIIIKVVGKEQSENLESGEQSVFQVLNGYAVRIENEINKAYENLSKLIYRLNATGTQIDIKPEGNQIVGTMVMSYGAIYKDEFS